MRSRKTLLGLVVTIAALCAAFATTSLGAGVGSQLRVSNMGTDGDAANDAIQPAVTRNYRSDEFLVVWAGDNVADGKTEIWGRKVNDAGNPVGDEFQISQSGGTDAVRNPSVAWNALDNEYLVVWEQDVAATPAAPGGGGGGGGLLGGLLPGGGGGTPATPATADTEIFAQRLTGDGTPKTTKPAPISSTGPAGNTAFAARTPDVAHNSKANTYYVVWSADEATDGDEEIHGQRLEADGDEVGGDDVAISDMGPNGNFDAEAPSIAYDVDANEYLVAWSADDDQDGVVDGEQEIYAQRLDTSGTATGRHNFRVSTMGDNGNAARDALDPDVVYSQVARRYLVVWSGDDTNDGAFDIHGQYVTARDDSTGADDFKITGVGGEGGAFTPAASASTDADDYLVTWSGGSKTLATGEREIFGQRMSTADEGVDDDFQISRTGPNGDNDSNALTPVVAHTQKEDRYFTFWTADDPDLADEEFEIYGRAATAAPAATASPPSATGPSTAGEDTTPPVMYFAVEPRSFSASEGATFSVPLSEDATVTIAIDKRPTGIRVQRNASSSRLSCMPRSRANLRKARSAARRSRAVRARRGRSRDRAINAFVSRRRCVRTIPAGTISQEGRFGRNEFAFDGTVDGKRLSPGRYRATVVAKDKSGNESQVRRRLFTVRH